MKKAIFVLLLVAAMGCAKEEAGPQMGCMTGIPKGYTNRGLIRCCTKEQYLAGNNVAAGGIASFTNYTSVTWTPISNCSDCK
jgi:hypothetical protein